MFVLIISLVILLWDLPVYCVRSCNLFRREIPFVREVPSCFPCFLKLTVRVDRPC